MALNYLLSPEFQIVNSAGKPATGGYLEVFIHGSRTRYYCASDFDGTLHPFQVPLDSLGGNVVLADDSNAYDVYIFNRYGSLLMSRYNVHPSSGGFGGLITSSDGTITVTQIDGGWDLSVTGGKAGTLKAGGDALSSDGYFSFRKLEGEGDAIYMDNDGHIFLEDGWYHFSATVKLNWNGVENPQCGPIRLSSGFTYDIIDFDFSYNHVDTVVLDGDIYIAPHSSQYISFGRGFTLSVMGMQSGMTAELVDCDIHTILGQGGQGGGEGEKNIHRLLRYYTNAVDADENHPAGDWLHDLDADDPTDPSGHPMVTADQLFDWYESGQVFDLYEGGAGGDITDWSAVYRMVTWQDQSDWWSQYAPVPGKACRLEFYRAGMYSVPNRVGLIAYIRYKDEDYMRLYQIKPGQDIWMMELQEALPYYGRDTHNGEFLRVKADGSGLEWVAMDLSDYITETDLQSALSTKQDVLTAGSNIQINGTTISATDTTYTAGPGVNINNDIISVDTSVVATQSDLTSGLADKQDVLTAGQNITIDSNNVISATGGGATYTAGNGIDITGDEISVDTSVVATQSDLAGKQDTLTAGTNIQINNDVISATDTTYTAGNGLTLNGTEFAADTTVLATQQDLSGKQDALTAGSNITISGDTISATDTTYSAGTGIDITGTTISADTSVLATQSDLSGKQDTLTAGTNIQINGTTISATDTTYTAGTGIDITGTTISADTTVLATQNDLSTGLASKQDELTAGSNIQINGTTISATDTTYTAGSGLTLTGTEFSADTTVLATQQDLSGKQDTLTAGSNITIQNNVISATDTTYIAGTGIDITGTTISADTTVLATQNDLSSKQDTLTAGSNIQINGTTISATDTTYSAGTGLSLTGTTFSVDDPLPAHTSSDEGKILKVDSNGDLEWGAESGGTVTDVQVNGTSVVSGGVADITVPAAQVNSDWTASSGVAEILHKPTEKTLAAGGNVTITEANDTVTISATDTTYTAGTGIDISNNEISVETPVDIVAGPGIVIDNPDGNTLRVSQAANYEVVLFSGTAANTNVVLNEALDNFERIKIYAYWKGTNTYEYYGYSVTEIYTSELSVGKRFTVNVFCNLNDSEFYSIANFSVASTKTQLNVVNVKRASLTEQLIAQNDGPTVYKVVGIHRIQGGS